MKATSDFLAIDLGASSGRVLTGLWDGAGFELREVHRFANAPVHVLGGLHWDALRLWAEIKEGLARYRQQYGAAPAGIALDAWGVDFALLDKAGRLIGNPFCYRDVRTNGMPEAMFERILKEELFRQTGNQPWRINTIFQLYSMVRSNDPQLQVAETLLMLPDLFSYWMSGEKRVELTEAATSGMLRVAVGEWARALLAKLDIPVAILPSLAGTGTVLAPLRREVAEEVGFDPAPSVIAVAAHDTASAVAGIPGMDSDSVFISCGTWSLMGIKVDAPVTTSEALGLGFTNEGGTCGKVLLLRNITGLWLLQECMRRWKHEGSEYSWEQLMGRVEQVPPFRSIIDPDGAHFVAPGDMVEAIRCYCHRTGQPLPDSPAAVTRCCLESLCLRHRWVLESLETLSKRRLSTIRIVGGGCQNRLLCQWTADACGRVVVAGPAEASALGNILVQAVATGHLAHIEDGWGSIAASCEQRVFEPQSGSSWDEAYQRFRDLAG